MKTYCRVMARDCDCEIRCEDLPGVTNAKEQAEAIIEQLLDGLRVGDSNRHMVKDHLVRNLLAAEARGRLYSQASAPEDAGECPTCGMGWNDYQARFCSNGFHRRRRPAPEAMEEVERVAQATFEAALHPHGYYRWNNQSSVVRGQYRNLARAALAAARPEGWRGDVHNAPQDGTAVGLLFWTHHDSPNGPYPLPRIAEWDALEDDGWWDVDGMGKIEEGIPTHWLPLPPMPENPFAASPPPPAGEARS